jgi:hypothetical protein
VSDRTEWWTWGLTTFLAVVALVIAGLAMSAARRQADATEEAVKETARSAAATEMAVLEAKRSADAAERADYQAWTPQIELTLAEFDFAGWWLVLHLRIDSALDLVRFHLIDGSHPAQLAFLRGFAPPGALHGVHPVDSHTAEAAGVLGGPPGPIAAGSTRTLRLSVSGDKIPAEGRAVLDCECNLGDQTWHVIVDTGVVPIIAGASRRTEL